MRLSTNRERRKFCKHGLYCRLLRGVWLILWKIIAPRDHLLTCFTPPKLVVVCYFTFPLHTFYDLRINLLLYGHWIRVGDVTLYSTKTWSQCLWPHKLVPYIPRYLEISWTRVWSNTDNESNIALNIISEEIILREIEWINSVLIFQHF